MRKTECYNILNFEYWTMNQMCKILEKHWICVMVKKCEFFWYYCLMYFIDYIVSGLFTQEKSTLLIPSQGSTYLFEVPSWRFILSQPYSGWINMNVYTVDQQIFLVHRPIYFWKYWKKLFAEITIPQVQLASICLNSAILTIE